MVEHGQGMSLDDMFDALAATQRRAMLLALGEHNPQDGSPASVPDVDAEADAAERVAGMRHVHLPKLVEYGLVEWDEETGEVTQGPNYEEIRPLLELLDDYEDELPADR